MSYPKSGIEVWPSVASKTKEILYKEVAYDIKSMDQAIKVTGRVWAKWIRRRFSLNGIDLGSRFEKDSTDVLSEAKQLSEKMS